MGLITLGLNYKSAPVEIREALNIQYKSIEYKLFALLETQNVSEVFVLSTCHRLEIYIVGHNIKVILNWLQHHLNFDSSILNSIGYVYTNKSAVSHLMRVACGLDSLVIGEVEILGQIKSAYLSAVQSNQMSKVLSRLCDQSFYIAKINSP